MAYKKGKMIYDPITGIVDVGSVLPMVDMPEFQALREKRQLGLTYLVFPDATHSRFIHSLGAYNRTKEVANRLFLAGDLTPEERRAVNAFALWHDIGHGPFSHVTEDLCEVSHKEATLQIIRNSHGAMEASDINPQLVEDMATGKNPLHLLVSDRNIGAEKLDYLQRDTRATIGGDPPGIEHVRSYTYFVDGAVVIDEKIVDYTMDLMDFYMRMYKSVYFRKSLLIAQRMFHKALYRMILEGELCRRDLPHMTDPELLAHLYLSKVEMVQKLYRCLRNREFFKEAIVIRPETFVSETRIAGKPIRVFEVSSEDMAKLVSSPVLQNRNQGELMWLEDQIASEIGLPKNSILVVPIFNPERSRQKMCRF